AVLSVLGDRTPAYDLAVWHGFGTPMLMSLTALVGGTVLYWLLRNRLNAAKRSPVIGRWRARKAFETVLSLVETVAAKATALMGTRRLQTQLRLLIGLSVIAGAAPLYYYAPLQGSHAKATAIDPFL